METLAYFDLAATYENTTNVESDPDPLKFFDGFNWKPPSSAWIRLLSTMMAILILSMTNGVFAAGTISARVNTKGSELHVRSSPGGRVIGSLPNGSQISLTGRNVNGWLQLANGNYVSSLWVRRGSSNNSGGTTTPSKGILKVGDRGSEVTRLQNSLKNRNFYNGPITGYYGDLTEVAVRKFQTSKGLRVDGIAGPQTLSTLAGNSSGSKNARVATRGSSLNIRSGPGTGYRVIGSINNRSSVSIYATTNGWHKIGDGQWVSSAWVNS